MKTIKRERQVRLDELLKHVWDGEIIGEKFYDQENNVLFIDKEDGEISQADHTCKNDLFTITEEVEVDEDTKLRNTISIDDIGRIYRHNNLSIEEMKYFHRADRVVIYSCKYIYLQNEDGSIGDLIWSKERGLVD